MAESMQSDIQLVERLRQHVDVLAELIGPRHVGRPKALESAATYVERQFLALGDEVERQTYDVEGTTALWTVDGTGAGVLSYRGNVYYTCIPELWLLRDENEDGQFDDGAERSAVTAAGGSYRFDDLLPGAYVVGLVVQDGWTQMYPGSTGASSVAISATSLGQQELIQLARQVAVQMTAHDALGSHARDELGITEMTSARPVQAALASAATFSVGAALPMLVAWISPLNTLIPLVAASSLVFLAGLGAVSAHAGGAKRLTAALRVTFWGALAMAITALIGRLFGTVVG